MGLSSFNLKGFYHSYAWHDLAVYVKEGLLFAWDLPLENSPDSYLCFWLILSNIEEVLSINPSANVFAFCDFNVHHKDWLTYSGGTNRPSEVCHNLIVSSDLTQMVNFLTRVPDCDSHSPAVLDLFISSDASICLIMTLPSLGNSDHVVSVSTLHQIYNKIPLFHHIDYDYSCADWDSLCDHLRDV